MAPPGVGSRSSNDVGSRIVAIAERPAPGKAVAAPLQTDSPNFERAPVRRRVAVDSHARLRRIADEPPIIPLIISVDDHLVEPPDLWQRWLPSRWQSAGPRVVRMHYEPAEWPAWPVVPAASGPETDFWIYEDVRMPILIALASAGLTPEEVLWEPITYDEMRPGCWRREERLADRDLINHVEPSVDSTEATAIIWSGSIHQTDACR